MAEGWQSLRLTSLTAATWKGVGWAQGFHITFIKAHHIIWQWRWETWPSISPKAPVGGCISVLHPKDSLLIFFPNQRRIYWCCPTHWVTGFRNVSKQVLSIFLPMHFRIFKGFLFRMPWFWHLSNGFTAVIWAQNIFDNLKIQVFIWNDDPYDMVNFIIIALIYSKSIFYYTLCEVCWENFKHYFWLGASLFNLYPERLNEIEIHYFSS